MEPSTSGEFEGVYGAQNQSVQIVHEDSSTGTTHKLSEGQRLHKNSVLYLDIHSSNLESLLLFQKRKYSRGREGIYIGVYACSLCSLTLLLAWFIEDEVLQLELLHSRDLFKCKKYFSLPSHYFYFYYFLVSENGENCGSIS
jgi:hypothetical protein